MALRDDISHISEHDKIAIKNTMNKVRALVTSLLILSTTTVHPWLEEKNIATKKDIPTMVIPPIVEENNEDIETPEKKVFKIALFEALKGMDSLTQIKEAWVSLVYKGLTQKQEKELPKTINFFPKEMHVAELPYSIIEVGTKIFKITPSFWMRIDNISMDKNYFHVKVGWMTVSKDKKNKLWEYLWRLYTQWEFGNYTLSNAKRIMPGDREKELKKLNNLNDPKNPDNKNNKRTPAKK